MPTLDHLNPIEVVWFLTSLTGLIVCSELYIRAQGDLRAVMNSRTNGARLMTAKSIKRRDLIRISQQVGLLTCATISALVDKVHEEYRWIIPSILTYVVLALALNAILDARFRTRLIDYIERVEAIARAGGLSAIQEQETESLPVQE